MKKRSIAATERLRDRLRQRESSNKTERTGSDNRGGMTWWLSIEVGNRATERVTGNFEEHFLEIEVGNSCNLSNFFLTRMRILPFKICRRHHDKDDYTPQSSKIFFSFFGIISTMFTPPSKPHYMAEIWCGQDSTTSGRCWSFSGSLEGAPSRHRIQTLQTSILDHIETT